MNSVWHSIPVMGVVTIPRITSSTSPRVQVAITTRRCLPDSNLAYCRLSIFHNDVVHRRCNIGGNRTALIFPRTGHQLLLTRFDDGTLYGDTHLGRHTSKFASTKLRQFVAVLLSLCRFLFLRAKHRCNSRTIVPIANVRLRTRFIEAVAYDLNHIGLWEAEMSYLILDLDIWRVVKRDSRLVARQVRRSYRKTADALTCASTGSSSIRLTGRHDFSAAVRNLGASLWSCGIRIRSSLGTQSCDDLPAHFGSTGQPNKRGS